MRVMMYVLCLLVAMPLQAQEQWLQHSAEIGDAAQDFTLPNAHGQSVSLYQLLENGPVVLSFYRGGWCPVCNTQLRQYQEQLEDFQALGAQLVAVSPEAPTKVQLTIVENHLKFEVLSDRGNAVAKAYGILWEVPESDREGFNAWLLETTGETLQEFNAQEGYELPVPATFVIGQDKKIHFAFKDVNYKNRADIEAIMQSLQSISPE